MKVWTLTERRVARDYAKDAQAITQREIEETKRIHDLRWSSEHITKVRSFNGLYKRLGSEFTN